MRAAVSSLYVVSVFVCALSVFSSLCFSPCLASLCWPVSLLSLVHLVLRESLLVFVGLSLVSLSLCVSTLWSSDFCESPIAHCLDMPLLLPNPPPSRTASLVGEY